MSHLLDDVKSVSSGVNTHVDELEDPMEGFCLPSEKDTVNLSENRNSIFEGADHGDFAWDSSAAICRDEIAISCAADSFVEAGKVSIESANSIFSFNSESAGPYRNSTSLDSQIVNDPDAYNDILAGGSASTNKRPQLGSSGGLPSPISSTGKSMPLSSLSSNTVLNDKASPGFVNQFPKVKKKENYDSIGEHYALKRRSKTAPAGPLNYSHGVETPGGMPLSLSQNNVGDYRTPQSEDKRSELSTKKWEYSERAEEHLLSVLVKRCEQYAIRREKYDFCGFTSSCSNVNTEVLIVKADIVSLNRAQSMSAIHSPIINRPKPEGFAVESFSTEENFQNSEFTRAHFCSKSVDVGNWLGSPINSSTFSFEDKPLPVQRSRSEPSFSASDKDELGSLLDGDPQSLQLCKASEQEQNNILSEEKRRRKLLKSKAKCRRMSNLGLDKKQSPAGKLSSFVPGNIELDGHDTVQNEPIAQRLRRRGNRSKIHFSPTIKSKSSSEKKKARRQSYFVAMDNTREQSSAIVSVQGSHPHGMSTSILGSDHSFSGLIQRAHSHDDSDISMTGVRSNGATLFADMSMSHSFFDGNHSIEDSHFSPLSTDESHFCGLIVGGSYQHCFDDTLPVVAVPNSNEKRVVNIFLCDQALSVLVYFPVTGKVLSVDLGNDWRWCKASPVGYLLHRNTQGKSGTNLRRQTKLSCIGVVYYFVSKHPNDLLGERDSALDGIDRSEDDINFNKMERSYTLDGQTRNNMVAMCENEKEDSFSGMVIEPTGECLFGIAMECQPPLNFHDADDQAADDELNSSTSSQHFLETHTGTQHTVRWQTGEATTQMDTVHERSTDSIESPNNTRMKIPMLSNLQISTQPASNRVNEYLDIISATEIDWSSHHLMTLILPYLVEDVDEVKKALSKGVAKMRKVYKSMRESCLPIQSTCKNWYLCVSMLASRMKSDLELGRSMLLKWDKYNAAMSRYASGKYLSEGVCKRVYAVTTMEGEKEAISVMDINDLQEREMDFAITQELQISLMCSSLFQLNICPNLIEMYALYQSTFDVPKEIWKAAEDTDSGKLTNSRISLKRGQVDEGLFQITRMSFCSGGDVEAVVRKKGLLEVPLVRSYAFQMCFSLYVCRDLLMMRHFDIKLLNFFSTDARSLLPPDLRHHNSCSGHSKKRKRFVELRIGYGRYVYCLVMDEAQNSPLIKLADFGTSAVGSGGLGDPITLQQV